MAMDRSPELKTACGSVGVMACEMSIKGGNFVWLTWQILCRKCVKHQQGKKTI